MVAGLESPCNQLVGTEQRLMSVPLTPCGMGLQWSEGFKVTAAACSQGRWCVVMAATRLYTRQVVETDFQYPSEAIHLRWDAGEPPQPPSRPPPLACPGPTTAARSRCGCSPPHLARPQSQDPIVVCCHDLVHPTIGDLETSTCIAVKAAVEAAAARALCISCSWHIGSHQIRCMDRRAGPTADGAASGARAGFRITAIASTPDQTAVFLSKHASPAANQVRPAPAAPRLPPLHRNVP